MWRYRLLDKFGRNISACRGYFLSERTQLRTAREPLNSPTTPSTMSSSTTGKQNTSSNFPQMAFTPGVYLGSWVHGRASLAVARPSRGTFTEPPRITGKTRTTSKGTKPPHCCEGFVWFSLPRTKGQSVTLHAGRSLEEEDTTSWIVQCSIVSRDDRYERRFLVREVLNAKRNGGI